MLVELGALEGMLKEGGCIGRGKKGVSPAVDSRLATHEPACAPSSRSEPLYACIESLLCRTMILSIIIII